MKLNGKVVIIYIIALIALIQGAYGGLQVTASGSSNGGCGSVSMNFDTLKDADVSSQITINGKTITPSVEISGPIKKFEQTHAVKDESGKKASVYVKVVNAPSGLDYRSEVLPNGGNLKTIEPWASAEQWLTVPKADYIKCSAVASYGKLSEDVGIEESKGSIPGDYVTLTDYDGQAYASETEVMASQKATGGSGKSIRITNSAKDSSGTNSISTLIRSNGNLPWAEFEKLNAISSAGMSMQVAQDVHIRGGFTSEVKSGANSKIRTSNYGTEYDLNMQAKKGSLPVGTVGYYVNPYLATPIQGAISGAINAAQSGDTINVAAGTYIENVQIDKSLTVNGDGADTTIVDGNRAGSVFKIGLNNPDVDVTLSGLTIQGGSGTAVMTNVQYWDPDNPFYIPLNYGGGIYSVGFLTLNDCIVTSNEANIGGGICAGHVRFDQKEGIGTLNINGGSIDQNQATWDNSWGDWIYGGGDGGGIDSFAELNLNSVSIDRNTARMGGGICNRATLNMIDGVAIDHNQAKYVEQDGGHGGGILNVGIVNLIDGSISYNIADGDGGGIFNGGMDPQDPQVPPTMYGIVNMFGGLISGNTASSEGGGIFNYWGGEVNLKGGTITENAASWGGGVRNRYAFFNFDGGQIYGNSPNDVYSSGM
jgi:hypothetical protein